MKMEWISNAKTSQKAEDGSVFRLRMNEEEIGVVIHHYARCGNLWFLTCKIIDCDTMSLETENFDEAVVKAQKIIDKKLNEIYFRLREFTLNVGENVMVKY